MVSPTSFFEHNLAVLRGQNLHWLNHLEGITQNLNSDIQVAPSKIQGYHAMVGGIFLNSKFDPVKEAQKMLENQSQNLSHSKQFVIFGLELGYFTKAVLDSYKELQVIVFEHSLTLIYHALNTHDFSLDLQSGRLTIIPIRRLQGAEIYFQDINPVSTKIFIHVASFNAYGAFYSGLKTTFQNMMMLKTVNQQTISRFDELWFKNTIHNLSHYIAYPGAEALKGLLKDKPVILIGAGPSLQQHKDFLLKNQNRITMIAVNTALSYLLEMGVTPHIIVVVDPQYKIMHHFMPLWRKFKKFDPLPLLVAEPTAYPLVVQKYDGKVIFSDVSLLKTMINPIAGQKSHLDAGGSVITMAYSLAILMQASPIIFLGLDLSYTNKTMHVKGNELEKTWYFDTQNRLNPIEKSHYQFTYGKKLKPHQGFWGQPVMVDDTFLTYIQWLENRFAYYKDTFKTYNCTEGGIAFSTIKNIPLKDVPFLNDLMQQNPPIHPNDLVIKNVNYSHLKASFNDILSQKIIKIEHLQTQCQNAIDLFESLLSIIDTIVLKQASTLENAVIESLSDLEEISLNIQKTLDQFSNPDFIDQQRQSGGDLLTQNIKKSLILLKAIKKSARIVKREYDKFIKKDNV